MFGIILVTHGDLGLEFKKALEHVLGAQEAMACISIGPDDDIEKRREELLKTAQELDKGAGVVLLSDMFGGTPSNLAISLLEHGHYEVIAGINLPILIKLASLRGETPMHKAVLEAQTAGQKHIHVATGLLKQNA